MSVSYTWDIVFSFSKHVILHTAIQWMGFNSAVIKTAGKYWWEKQGDLGKKKKQIM